MRSLAMFSLLKPIMRLFEREIICLFAFLNRHYTPLAVVVMVLGGAIFFFFTSYLFRYNHWNYWLWKNRAITKTIYLGIVLITLKVILGVL